MPIHRLWTVLTALTLTLGVGLTACSNNSSDSTNGDNTGNTGAVDCSAGTVPKFSELAAIGKCTSCHSSSLTGAGRSDAPTDVNFDTYTAARPLASDALIEIESNSMPPAGSPTLTAEELDAIKRWAACGTPE